MARPRIYSDEERKARRKATRAKWLAKHPERMAAARKRWVIANPDYHAQWRRDKRAEMREDGELPPRPPQKTPWQRQAQREARRLKKREYDRRYYQEHREKKLAAERNRRVARRLRGDPMVGS